MVEHEKDGHGSSMHEVQVDNGLVDENLQNLNENMHLNGDELHTENDEVYKPVFIETMNEGLVDEQLPNKCTHTSFDPFANLDYILGPKFSTQNIPKPMDFEESLINLNDNVEANETNKQQKMKAMKETGRRHLRKGSRASY